MPIDDLDPRLAADYEVLDKLRQGGSSARYRVRHRASGETRVAEVLRPGVGDTEAYGRRFAREARALEGRHPHVARLFDHGIAESPGAELEAWIVREHVPGRDLEELASSEPLPPVALCVTMARQALDGVGWVHGRGLRVRDLGPSSLVLGRAEDGGPRLVLVDPGIGRGWQEELDLTVPGSFLGRLRHASPEQFDDPSHVGPTSDLYALGLVFYELLTGRFPIVADTASALVAGHLFRPPLAFDRSDPDGRVPEPLRRWLLRALAKEPSDRWPDADAMAADLERAATNAGFEAPSTSEIEPWLPAAEPRDEASDDEGFETIRVPRGEETRALPTLGRPDAAEPEADRDATAETRVLPVTPADPAVTRALPTRPDDAASEEPPIAHTRPIEVARPPEPGADTEPRAQAGRWLDEPPPAGSLTLPMETIEGARRRAEARARGSVPEPPPAEASSAEASSAEPVPSTPTPPDEATRVLPPSPPPEEPARPRDPSVSGLGFGGADDDAPSLEDLGFGGGSPTPPSRGTPSRGTPSRGTTTGPPSQGRPSPPGGGASRTTILLGVVVALALVFLLSYMLSGLLAGDAVPEPTPAADAPSDETAPAVQPSPDTPPADASTVEAPPEPAPPPPEPAAAAAPGWLAIDATPWAEVERLVDAGGGEVPFPGVRITPVRLSLPPGSYRVELVHPPTGERRTLEVEVTSDAGRIERVRFAGLDVEDYFRHVDW